MKRPTSAADVSKTAPPAKKRRKALAKKPSAKVGRPSGMTETVVAHILEQIVAGRGLVSICRDDKGMPHYGTVMRWIDADEKFRERYTRAREMQADTLADQIIDISDDGRNDTYKDDEGRETINYDVVARSRLRVESRKWVAAKLKPKKYGDKVTQEVTGADGGPVQVETKAIPLDFDAVRAKRVGQ